VLHQSDSGISVSDDEETLVDQSRDLLRHVVDSCGKKAVRVLELGGGGGKCHYPLVLVLFAEIS
jgi:hypothetical protein